MVFFTNIFRCQNWSKCIGSCAVDMEKVVGLESLLRKMKLHVESHLKIIIVLGDTLNEMSDSMEK